MTRQYPFRTSLLPFSVESLQVTSVELLQPEVGLAARKLFQQYLLEIIESFKADSILDLSAQACMSSAPIMKRKEDAFQVLVDEADAANADRPDADDHQNNWVDPDLTDDESNPKLGEITLAIQDLEVGDDFIGCLHLYNLDVLEEDESRVKVCSMVAPGIPLDGKFDDRIADMFLGMLDTTMYTVGGQLFDLDCWMFPTEGPSFTAMPALITNAEAAGFTVTMQDGRIRRIGD